MFENFHRFGFVQELVPIFPRSFDANLILFVFFVWPLGFEAAEGLDGLQMIELNRRLNVSKNDFWVIFSRVFFSPKST